MVLARAKARAFSMKANENWRRSMQVCLARVAIAAFRGLKLRGYVGEAPSEVVRLAVERWLSTVRMPRESSRECGPYRSASVLTSPSPMKGMSA